MNHWLKDFRTALYSLSKRPGFVLVVILTLSLTLGAFITMVTLNYTVLLKPLPYPQQNSLFVIEGERYDKGKFLGSGVHSYAGAVDMYKKNPVLDETVMLHYEEQIITNLAGQPKLFTTYTTPELFSMLGAKMALGRNFDSKEGLDSNIPVAVISYDTWQQNLGGREDILDQKLQIGDVSFNIVGVLGQSFIEPMLYQSGRQTRIWLPFDFNRRDEQTRRNWTTAFFDLKLVGKLKKGIRKQEANQYFSTAMNERFVEAAREFSWGKNASIKVTLRSFEDIIVGSSRSTSLMMLAGVFALLLIACANIANLFLSRAAEKQRQYAIQATLGAQKFHIFRGIFIESLVLTLGSTILALLLAQLSFSLLQQHGEGHLARLNELSLSPIILLFSLLVAFLLATMFGAIISSLIDYRSLNNILRSSGKGSGLQISKRTRNILIISQVALAGVLLSANFTLFKSSMDVINQPSGFATDNILWVDLESGGQEFHRQERIAFIDGITTKLMQMPEVKQVSNTLYPPFITNSWTSILTETQSGTGSRVLPNVNMVDQHYLTTFDLALVTGRNFKPEEIRDSAKVLIINETVAKEFGGSTEVLGKNLYWEEREDPYKVIGIIKDVIIPRVAQVPQMFAGRTSSMTFMITLKPNQSISKTSLTSVFRGLNKNLRIGSFVKVDNAYQDLLARDISIAVITIALSILTLLLASIGIYGVLSYSINLRTYELGVRMALGGSPKAISKLVFTDSSKPVLYGFLVSIVILISIYIYLSQQTDLGVSIEVPALIVTFVLVLFTSFVACFIPLQRIVRAQPVKALQ